MTDPLLTDNAPFDIWVKRHLQVALACLGQFSRNPISFFFTTAVIGIALSLPISLHLLINNIEHISQDWALSSSITLFLKHDLSPQEIQLLHKQLSHHKHFQQVKLITSDEAMTEFRSLSGFADALDMLNKNPLPAVILIEPKANQSSPQQAQALLNQLKKMPEVDLVQFDMQWLKRFHAITHIAQRAATVLAALLGLAVLLIIGNTIRLEIQNRKAEIEITQLIGATNSFIRRPFLYTGFWYGFTGGIIAWILTSIAFMLLADPIARLSELYNSPFILSGFDAITLLTLIITSSLLGLIGSWIAVGRHLNFIVPS